MLPAFVNTERRCRWRRCAVFGCVLVCPVCGERVIWCVRCAMSVWFGVICERQGRPVKPEWSVSLDTAICGNVCVEWIFVCLRVSGVLFVCLRVSGVLFVCLILPVGLRTCSVFTFDYKLSNVKKSCVSGWYIILSNCQNNFLSNSIWST